MVEKEAGGDVVVGADAEDQAAAGGAVEECAGAERKDA